MRNGIFITFEGGDGCGKSTQIQMLKEKLEDRGENVVLTREPGGTVLGEKIRDIILDNENAGMSAMTEAMLYAAVRAQHLEDVVKPALAEGKVVICDRFVDSSIAYQGYGRELGDKVKEINDYVIGDYMPDMTFFLMLEPEMSQKRMHGRVLDRIENEDLSFHNNVMKGYEEIAKEEPGRIIKVDASKSISEIHQEISDKVISFLEMNKEYESLIDKEKVQGYVEEDMIMEFDSAEECMRWSNTYDFQNYKSVEEMKESQGMWGFGIGKKWYSVCYEEALAVWKTFVRPLTEKDAYEVSCMDELSGNYVQQWIEDNVDCAWGLFKNGALIGYCTIGYADDCTETINNYPGWTYDSLLLSDVYVKKEHRGQGLGLKMVDDAIKMRTENEKELVFISVLYDSLSDFYSKIDFEIIEPGYMVRDERCKEKSSITVDVLISEAHKKMEIDTGGNVPGLEKKLGR